jgi:ATP-dependent Lhr-like helicase
LLSAPTGTGKTLAAFLPILAHLLQGTTEAAPSCLYVAPLRALVNDMARTLQTHLDGLAAFTAAAAEVRVAVRTGDTPSSLRRALRVRPPAILLTTPESLAVLLCQPWSHELFGALRWVVVDEVHALAPTKRGADLALSLERLTALSGGALQRIGLSATATPAADAARWLAGAGRPCAVAQADEPAPLEVRIDALRDTGHFLAALVQRLVPELHTWRATLVFTNTRRVAEQLAWALRRNCPQRDHEIAVHHSALSPPRRRAVEEAFKQGRLRAVVSSTSLELGIDVGPVDLVALVHPPGDVVRLLQRLGRSGHGPARVRRGLVLTSGPAELLEAVVTVASGRIGQTEPLRLPRWPLDVLCQQIVGMACARPWSTDEAFALIRGATPFDDLSRQDFDSCLRYLLGLPTTGGATGSQRWLPPRLGGDVNHFWVRDVGTARLMARNLGTILEERSVAVRGVRDEQGPGTVSDDDIGHVDEGFADNLRPGDRFLLDGRCLEVRQRDTAVVWVDEVSGKPAVPRWAGTGLPLSTELARRLYLLRVRAAEALAEGPEALIRLLGEEYDVRGPAAAALVQYFQHQESISEIPTESTALIEVVAPASGAAAYYWHTPLNRLGNEALVRVAVHRLARDGGFSATPVAADLGFAILVPAELPRAGPTGQAAVLRALLDPGGFERDLETALCASETHRHRFGQVARTGLMLLRNPLGRRRKVGGPDWAARRLFDQVVARDPGFVLMRQARRELLAGLCDAEVAVRYAHALPGCALRCRRLPHPSPFAEAWTQCEVGATEPPADASAALQRLHESLLRPPGVAGEKTRTVTADKR